MLLLHLKISQTCHAPSLCNPRYQFERLPELQGTKLAWGETIPIQHKSVFQGSVGNAIKSLLCRGNLLGYSASVPPLPVTDYQASSVFCGSRTRPNSILLSPIGIGLMSRWGQGAEPQSKECGYYYSKFASCFLCTCLSTYQESPLWVLFATLSSLQIFLCVYTCTCSHSLIQANAMTL